MPRHIGELPPSATRAQTGVGDPTTMHETVFPIVSQKPDGTLVPIGTGFFIGQNGLFVTAAHVVRDVLDDRKQATAPFGLLHIYSDQSYVIRPITRATYHETADVAVGFAAPVVSEAKGALQNTILTLSRSRPRVGDTIHTYAFPRTRVEPGTRQTVHLTPGSYAGTIVEEFPDGRDSVLLPGPCYQTTMVIHGGASGGPVFNQNGCVIGINSTGYADEELSFVSCITSILNLRLVGVRLPGDNLPRDALIQELCDRDFIPML